MTSKIPTRSEIPESDTWDLSHLFQTEEAYREAFAQLRDAVSENRRVQNRPWRFCGKLICLPGVRKAAEPDRRATGALRIP